MQPQGPRDYPGDFNSRTSCEVRLPCMVYNILTRLFQLTHLLRGATCGTVDGGIAMAISTHAPLARCDEEEMKMAMDFEISTHAPLARCDSEPADKFPGNRNFNSRTSCEVRRRKRERMRKLTYFNSRTSCEVRLDKMMHTPLAQLISTHAPLARCDTSRAKSRRRVFAISTHAPLARCDRPDRRRAGPGRNFNSRTSCEVRRTRT